MYKKVTDSRLKRLKIVIEDLKNREIIKTQEDISTKMGYSRPNTVSDIINERAKLSTKFVKSFSNAFGVNSDWIETGTGEMFVPADTSTDEDLAPKPGKRKEIIPLGKHVPLRLTADQYKDAFGDWPGLPMYNAPVTASFVETYRDDTVYQPQYYLHDPRFRDCDFGAIITGDSMHSEIRHGDFIACKEITDKRFIVYGDIYYVIATNGLETCKYVNVDPKDENRLLLVAKNEKISPSPLPKDMILRLFKVRGIVRGY